VRRAVRARCKGGSNEARRDELLSFPELLTLLCPESVERQLQPTCAALGARALFSQRLRPLTSHSHAQRRHVAPAEADAPRRRAAEAG